MDYSLLLVIEEVQVDPEKASSLPKKMFKTVKKTRAKRVDTSTSINDIDLN